MAILGGRARWLHARGNGHTNYARADRERLTTNSFNKRAFVRALQALLPEIAADDLKVGGAGVRAQALDPSGKLLDDFRIVEAERQVHVLNAPSPAATASISIGEAIAGLARSNFDLG